MRPEETAKQAAESADSQREERGEEPSGIGGKRNVLDEEHRENQFPPQSPQFTQCGLCHAVLEVSRTIHCTSPTEVRSSNIVVGTVDPKW